VNQSCRTTQGNHVNRAVQCQISFFSFSHGLVCDFAWQLTQRTCFQIFVCYEQHILVPADEISCDNCNGNMFACSGRVAVGWTQTSETCQYNVYIKQTTVAKLTTVCLQHIVDICQTLVFVWEWVGHLFGETQCFGEVNWSQFLSTKPRIIHVPPRSRCEVKISNRLSAFSVLSMAGRYVNEANDNAIFRWIDWHVCTCHFMFCPRTV